MSDCIVRLIFDVVFDCKDSKNLGRVGGELCEIYGVKVDIYSVFGIFFISLRFTKW